MKSNEEFRASVYARAGREKQRIAARRQKMRNASLSAAMMLLVATLAVSMTRSTRGPESISLPAPIQEQRHAVNQGALGARMVLLVGEQAVVLENEAQQKEFVSQYKAAMNLSEGEGAPFPAADTAKAIHSTDELTEFLAELPEAAESMRLDYDEAFFAGNDLYAMPMELAQQPESSGEPTTTAVAEPTAFPFSEPDVVLPGATVPDVILPEATIPDAVRPSDADAPTEPAESETTLGEQATTVLASLPEAGLLQGADVKVLLLVPVNKG